MHIIKLKSSLKLNEEIDLQPGSYLVEDLNAADFMSFAQRGSAELNFVPGSPKPFSQNEDWNGRKILIVRPGGFGDLLFLTPSVAEIKKRWPACEIHVAALSRYHPILKTSQVDAIIHYPVEIELASKYDAIVFLENVIEGNEEAHKIHAVDLVAKNIGIGPLEDKMMRYAFTKDEIEWAEARYPRATARRVGIQISASSHSRTYPRDMTVKVTNMLAAKGIEVYLIGHPGEVSAPTPPPIRNLTIEGISFRQSVAAMATCDLVVGPDSVMIHIAGAIGMPAIGLYGAFPWKLRTAYAPSVFALQGNRGCEFAPCFYHGSRISPHFPTNGPCFKTGKCEVMASIEPERVVTAINSELDKIK